MRIEMLLHNWTETLMKILGSNCLSVSNDDNRLISEITLEKLPAVDTFNAKESDEPSLCFFHIRHGGAFSTDIETVIQDFFSGVHNLKFNSIGSHCRGRMDFGESLCWAQDNANFFYNASFHNLMCCLDCSWRKASEVLQGSEPHKHIIAIFPFHDLQNVRRNSDPEYFDQLKALVQKTRTLEGEQYHKSHPNEPLQISVPADKLSIYIAAPTNQVEAKEPIKVRLYLNPNWQGDKIETLALDQMVELNNQCE